MTVPRISHTLQRVKDEVITDIGLAVPFYHDKGLTLKALIAALKEFGDDITGEDPSSIDERQNLDRQLTTIYTAWRAELVRIISESKESVEITIGIGDALIDAFSFKTLEDTKEIFRYDREEGVWVSNGRSFIEKVIKGYALHLSKHQIDEIIYHIQTSTYADREEFIGCIAGNLLHVRNGWLNMDTLELLPHTKEMLSTSKIAASFDRKAGPVEFVKIINQALDPEYRPQLLKILGHFLIPDCRYEKMAIFVGEGHNRKGTIIFAISAVLGAKNCCHISLQDISDDKFASAGFYGKMANLVADLSSKKIAYTGRLKELVSGDWIRAQHKHRQPFDFRNSAKMLFSANEIPESSDQTNAYFRRLVILPFSNFFEIDSTLQERLTTEYELSGILNLMVWGRKLLITEGFEDIPIEKIRLLYNKNASIIREFLDKECVIDLQNEKYMTLSETLQSAYKGFGEKKGKNRRTLDIRQLGEELNKLGVAHKQLGPRNNRRYYYIGIVLRSEITKSQQTLV